MKKTQYTLIDGKYHPYKGIDVRSGLMEIIEELSAFTKTMLDDWRSREVDEGGNIKIDPLENMAYNRVQEEHDIVKEAAIRISCIDLGITYEELQNG